MTMIDRELRSELPKGTDAISPKQAIDLHERCYVAVQGFYPDATYQAILASVLELYEE